ncbi:universal stress protein [Nocardia transvalensis]|uniref:universal stress protein n=1 Tax=Nocardia transvalensis TaxID=37333 RepID=UPI001894ACC7|nr:universal stress protein [Nocardia transvalensis]MBF6328411.1 universal stress protein [Nocardia transvalensis]
MNHILVRPTEPAMAAAQAIADIIDGQVRAGPPDLDDDSFLHALSDPDITLGVVGLDGRGWRIVQHSDKPIVLVPAHARPSVTVKRILVPLDGTDESANAVAETVRLFRAAGTELVVLHVFHTDTAPAYWDQAAHHRAVWEQEFLARYCAPHFPGPAPALTLRTGAPGEHVCDVAADRADLIILGWSQRLEPGRAQTVRRTVRDADVPVMLVPTG